MRLHVKEDFPNSIDGLASGMGQGNPEYLRTLILIAAAVLAVGCLTSLTWPRLDPSARSAPR